MLRPARHGRARLGAVSAILAPVAAVVLGAVAALAPPAARASVCQSIAMDLPGARLVRLAAAQGGDAEGRVTIRFVGHSTYRIETGGGVTIATDYSGWAGPVEVPDIVTMNHAHETHWTAYPDPRIPHVLRGWGRPGEGPARHWLRVGDVLARNVTTDIRGWGGGVEKDGNSIFVFEVGRLCIGHLGHLHHALGPSHFAAIGRLDVVMAAVDGGATLNLPDMIALLERVRASVVLPMHYWASGSLGPFLAAMSDEFRIIRSDVEALTLTPRTLPATPSVIVLPMAR